ncbi:phage tail protein [Pluralibacter gergoviae]|uniref:phage tail protein n=1 Tax=Pluralibacter gergoviae TaxID=61647 RepID=UPI001E54D3A9|nr:phage tail protein [Pluralibacter gergoviae]
MTLLTKYGAERIAQAALSGVAVDFAEMAVGDGGGVVPKPDASQDGLVNEVYRAPLNRVEIADDKANIIRTELIILPQVGGFWIREAALLDEHGQCLAVASLPPSYKPLLSDGSGRLHSVNLWIAVSDTAQVELKADPSVILATAGEVRRAKDEAKDYADNEISILDRDLREVIAAAIAEAKADAWEEDNPPGTVRFFNQTINPNERWPHSKWAYTGENRSIRVGAADGSNVGTMGGSDTVSIGKNNLPEVKIGVSGETGDTDLGRKTTEQAGAFDPVSDARFNRLSARASDIDGDFSAGDSDDRNPEIEYRVGNMTPDLWAAATIRPTPNHGHEINLGKHKHDFSGKTDNLGSGEAISVVESHILLMCWARVA